MLSHLDKASDASKPGIQAAPPGAKAEEEPKSLFADKARVRLGPLLGPFFVLLHHGIRQGGRSTVQLFGALAKGLTDAVKLASIGVGLGHSATVCQAILRGRGAASPAAEPDWDSIHFRSIGRSSLGGRLVQEAAQLGALLDAQGLGIAWHAQQLPVRAESAVPFG